MRTALIASLLTALIAADGAQAKVAVFVGPQTRGGFVDVDSGIVDSIKDIQDEIRKSRLVALASNERDATVVLLVSGRRIAGETGSSGITIPGGTIGGGTVAGVQQPTYALPGTTFTESTFRHAIETIVKVGSYEKPTTSMEGSWKNAAKQVVKDLTVWVEANRERLVKRSAT